MKQTKFFSVWKLTKTLLRVNFAHGSYRRVFFFVTSYTRKKLVFICLKKSRNIRDFFFYWIKKKAFVFIFSFSHIEVYFSRWFMYCLFFGAQPCGGDRIISHPEDFQSGKKLCILFFFFFRVVELTDFEKLLRKTKTKDLAVLLFKKFGFVDLFLIIYREEVRVEDQQ